MAHFNNFYFWLEIVNDLNMWDANIPIRYDVKHLVPVLDMKALEEEEDQVARCGPIITAKDIELS